MAAWGWTTPTADEMTATEAARDEEKMKTSAPWVAMTTTMRRQSAMRLPSLNERWRYSRWR